MKILTKALILCVFTFIFSVSFTQASHILGGDLSYFHEPLPGQPYRFRVVLQYYRYCAGIAVPGSLNLNITPVQPCAGASSLPSQTMLRNSGAFSTLDFFPGYSNFSMPFNPIGWDYYKRKIQGYSTTCTFGNNPPASMINDVQFYEYQTYVIIPQTMRCDQWLFWTSECCRNQVANLQWPSSFTFINQAMVNTNFLSPTDIANGMRQNSPRFITLPIQLFPINQRSFISPSVLESDGDSLSFSFAAPRTQDGLNQIPYIGVGTSNTPPVNPFPTVAFQPNGLPQIDRASGMVSFVPSTVNKFAAILQCDEWRRVNNIPVRIGYVRRDLELNFYAGNLPFLNTLNQSPTIKNMAGDFDGPTPTGTPVDFEKYRIDAPVCQSTCFTLEAKDFDIFDEVLLMATDSFGSHPNFRLPLSLNAISTFYPDPVNPKLQICINPEGSALRNHPYLLHVHVSDDFAYAGETSYTIKIYVTDGGFAQVGPDITVCNGAPTPLTALGGLPGATYQWWPSSGLSSSTIQSPIYTPAANPPDSVTFSVRITQPSGCVSEKKLTVFHRDSLSLLINDGADTLIKCPGVDLQLEAKGATQYVWTPAIGLSDPFIPNPIASPTQNTLYTATGVSGSCIGSASVWVIVDSLLQINTQDSIGMCEGQSFQVNSSGAHVYQWSPQTNITDANTCCPTLSPDISSTYFLRAESQNGCAYFDTLHVKVGPNVAPILQVTDKSHPSLRYCAGDSILIRHNLMMSLPVTHAGALNCGSSIRNQTSKIYTSNTTVGNTTGMETSQYLFSQDFQNYGAYQHILIRAADLQQSGLQPGFIKSISFVVSEVSNNFLDTFFVRLAIKCKPANHSFTSYPNMGVLMESGFKSIYNDLYKVKLGVNKIQLDEPYPWDGVSSILLRFCVGNLRLPATNPEYAKLAVTQTTYPSTASESSWAGSSLCNFVLYATTQFNRRPVLGFEMISSVIPEDFQYTWTPISNTAGLTASQANALVSFTDSLQTGALLNISDTGSYTYRVTAHHILGCPGDSTLITVNFRPTAPAVNLSPKQVCAGSFVTLDANGKGFTQWYADADKTQLVGVGSPFQFGPVLNPIILYAVIDTMVPPSIQIGVDANAPGTTQNFSGVGQVRTELFKAFTPMWLGSIDLEVIQGTGGAVVRLATSTGTVLKHIPVTLPTQGPFKVDFNQYLRPGEYTITVELTSSSSLKSLNAVLGIFVNEIPGVMALVNSATVLFNWQIASPLGCGDPSPQSITLGNVAPIASANYQTFDKNVFFTNTSQSSNSFVWDFGDGVGTSTLASPSYTYASYGTYTVKMIASGACGPSDSTQWTLTISSPTGIPITDLLGPIEIYPNPVNTYLTIKAEKSFLYELWSITGVLVTKGTSGEEILELDVQTILPGAYVLKISNTEGILIKQILKH